MKADVTIIIPAWNASGCIRQAIDSAMAQQALRVEIIVADDASTDDTGDVVKGIRGPDIQYVRLAVNGGPAAARNAALQIATGSWISVLDADDVMQPERLKTLIAIADAEDLDVITDNMWIASPDGTRSLFFNEELDGTVQRLDLSAYIARNLMFARSRGDGYLKPIFKASFIRQHHLRYDPALRIGEDFILMAEALANGARYGRHRSAGYVYTTSAGSISHRLSASQARAMANGDERFLAKYGARLTMAERLAMHQHLHRLRDAAGFVAMVDAMKAGRIGVLAREAVRRPAAIRHFAMPIKARLSRFGLFA